jgi:hypothetical protein
MFIILFLFLTLLIFNFFKYLPIWLNEVDKEMISLVVALLNNTSKCDSHSKEKI